jgi:hypothetical protein
MAEEADSIPAPVAHPIYIAPRVGIPEKAASIGIAAEYSRALVAAVVAALLDHDQVMQRMGLPHGIDRNTYSLLNLCDDQIDVTCRLSGEVEREALHAGSAG